MFPRIGWVFAVAAILTVGGMAMHGARAEAADAAKVMVCGHNGYFKEEPWPESSIAGFVRQIELGCDGCEIDLFRLPDGHFIVYHDAEEKFALRALDAWGDINGLDYAHVRAFNKAFYFLGDARDEPILLLDDVLAFSRETGFQLVYDPKFIKQPGADGDLKALRELTRRCEADGLVFWKKNAFGRLKTAGADMEGVQLLPPGKYYAKDDDWWRLYHDATASRTEQVSVYFPTVSLDALGRGPRRVNFDVEAFRRRCASMRVEPAYPDVPDDPKALVAALESSDLAVAHAAFFHVRRRELQEAAPVCMRILEQCDKANRLARAVDAARTLGALRCREAVDLLARTCGREIAGGGAANVRGACAWALAVTVPDDEKALDGIAAVLRYPERSFYDAKFPKRVASDALCRVGVAGWRRLVGALSCEDDQARLYAAWALIRVGEGCLGEVRPLLDAKTPVLTRERAAWIVGWLRDGESAKSVVALLDATEEALRARGAWALGRMGVSDARERLKAMAESDPSPEVRVAARQAAARIGQ